MDTHNPYGVLGAKASSVRDHEQAFGLEVLQKMLKVLGYRYMSVGASIG